MHRFGINIPYPHKAFMAWSVVCLVFLFPKLYAGEIIVGGTLAQDEIWTPDNTYIVSQDLRIGQNILLTILPGVTVKVDQGRGIHLNGGDLIVGDYLGVNTDSVWFLGNYRDNREGWKWKGIVIENVGDENTIHFSYVSIQDAEIAMDLKNSHYVLVQQSTIYGNQNIGIRMTDCSRCIVEGCFIAQNWDGIEMVATSSRSLIKNEITNNRILNSNHNVYMRVENDGSFIENTLSYNVIEGANNGIWMDSESDGLANANIISKNVFVNNGSGFGYGFLLAFDSTHVSNNIFWQNNIALEYDPVGQNSNSQYNSYFQNVRGILMGSGSMGNDISHNTFSNQMDADFDTKETIGITFQSNNLFPVSFDDPTIINNSRNDLLVSQVFWNTIDSLDIDRLIWDQQDDPMLGKLYYQPFLTEPDTTWPISPPSHVIKQWVEGKVKISWNANPEADVNGYRVYFGGFEFYQFSSHTDVGSLRSVFLDDVLLTDSIAVTSYDSEGYLVDAQLVGHESPYSFADYYPYAGEDQQFCINQSQFEINQSTAPFLYTTLSWKTSGDGTFNNPATVSPVYFPGEQDLLNGSVNLSINVLRGGRWLSDEMQLVFVDIAEVNAGNDTTIFVDETLDLYLAEESFVNDLYWTTTGDGIFNADTLLNPIYTPGEMDVLNGSTDLVLIGENVCGIDQDTLHLSVVQRYTINGTIWDGEAPSGFCAVVAIETNSSADRAVELSSTDFSGNFVFNDLFPGDYLLYAVPDTLTQNGFYPGYYVNAGRWHQAYKLTLDADVYDVDIHLPVLEFELPEGMGQISGHFSQPHTAFKYTDIFCQSWFDATIPGNYCKTGPSNVTILLYNSTHEKVLDYTITDSNGDFFFHHLPMGNYIVDAELAGFVTNPSSILQLSTDNPRVGNVEIDVTQKEISILVPENQNENPKGLMRLFPNPTETDITLSALHFPAGKYEVIIYDVCGRTKKVTYWLIEEGMFYPKHVLDISKFDSGIYFGYLRGVDEQHHFSFVVK